MKQTTYVIGTNRRRTQVVVKIGKAVDPKKRLKELQTGHPEELKIFATFPNEGDTAEASLHARYRQYRTRGSGEWFSLPRDEFRALLKSKSKPGHSFPCEVCGAADPDDGLLYVVADDVFAYQRQLRHSDSRADNGWGRFPDRVRWRTACFGCAPEDCYYDIPLSDVLEDVRLLHWTSHLMSKGWLRDTDWQYVLDRAISDRLK